MDITAHLKRHAKAAKRGQTKRIPLNKLRLDGDTQPRVSIDTTLVDEYSEGYAGGVVFPPIDVFFDGVDYWIADGFHRWHAAMKAGLDAIDCCIHKGTVEDAKWFSYAANQTHGSRRSNSDKAKAVKAALLHTNGAKMSDHQIAEYVGVSQPMVGKYRNDLAATNKDYKSPARTGKDGRTIDTSNIGKKSPPREQPANDNPPSQPRTRDAAVVPVVQSPRSTAPDTNLLGEFKNEVIGMIGHLIEQGIPTAVIVDALEDITTETKKK